VTGNLPKGLDALRWKTQRFVQGVQQPGAPILQCHLVQRSLPGFGISAYPDIEANMKIMRAE